MSSIAHVFLLVLILLPLCSAQPVIGAFDANSTNALRDNNQFCSKCYSVKSTQLSYCYRLALSKFFNTVCQRTGDVACQQTSTEFKIQAFNVLNALPTSPSTYPGLKLDDLECVGFAANFVNSDNTGISGRADVEIFAEGIEKELEDDLKTEFSIVSDEDGADENNEITVQVDSVILYLKPRPSGREDPLPDDLPDIGDELSRMIVVDDMKNNASLNDTTHASKDDPMGEMLSKVQMSAPRSVIFKDDVSVSDVGALTPIGLASQIEVPHLLRQNRGRIPWAIRLTARFSQGVQRNKVQRSAARVFQKRANVFRNGNRATVRRRNSRTYDVYGRLNNKFRQRYS